MFCPHCGKEIGQVSFCPFYGQSVAHLTGERVKTAPEKKEAAENKAGEKTAKKAEQQRTKAAKQAEKQAKKAEKQKKSGKKGGKAWLWVILALVLTAGLLVGGFFGARALLSLTSEAEEALTEETKEEELLAVEKITSDLRDLPVGKEATSLVTVELKEKSEAESLQIVTRKGKKLGTVSDNGTDGDERADDGVYSGKILLYSEKAEELELYAFCDGIFSDRCEKIYFYPEFKSEYYEEYEDLEEELNGVISQYNDLEEAHKAVMALLREKKRNREIADYEFESGSITVELNSGAVYVYTYNPGGIFKAPAAATAAGESETVGLYTISPNLNQVLTMQPYRHELGEGGVDTAAESVEDSEYNFSFSANLDNGAVDAALLKRLNEYNVILLDGHGGHNSVNHSFFGFGTAISQEQDEKFWVDLYYDRIIRLSGGQYGVTPAFFDRYYQEGDFGDTVVYLGSCHGADDNVLVNTLLSKGVDAVFAYENSVSVSYDKNMVKTVFQLLSEEKETPVTVKEALDGAKKKHGNRDDTYSHWYNWLFGNYEKEANRACLRLFGDEDFTLSMKSSSLRGKVGDAETGRALSNAEITAAKDGKNASDHARSDGEGNFKYQLPAGLYDVTVKANGYLDCTVTEVKLEENATTYLQNTILLEQKEDDVIALIGGKVINAVSGEAVAGATVRFRADYNRLSGDFVKTESGEEIALVSDAEGAYHTSALPYGYYTAEVSKEGYATQHANVIASDKEALALGQNLLLVPEGQGNEFRITLEWAANPRDEDAHLIGSEPHNFHVYYSDKTASSNGEMIANLDHDDTQGNGFETVTLKADPNGFYQYYVYHYEGSGSLSTSNAIVKVYQGGVLIKQYNVPVDQGTGRYWNVFRIVNGRVVTLNRIGSSVS